MTVTYDGTEYAGFQVQPGQRTIQGELERAIEELTKQKVRVVGSGRTDAGVHALGQVIHFNTDSSIPVDRWPLALHTKLPKDIVITKAEEVHGQFHARFDAKEKIYIYTIDRGHVPHVLMRRYAYHFPYALDIEKMREGAAYLIGTHDFTSFSSSKTEVQDKVREMYEITMIQEGPFLKILCRGNGFLYQMVRIIIGTLLEVGEGKRDPETIKSILEKKDRILAGRTVPPHGLVLYKVNYK